MAPTTTNSPPAHSPDPSCGVCTDFRVLRRKTKKMPTIATTAAASTAAASSSQQTDPYSPLPCPPDAADLGSSTWTFLHTTASHYPETPSETDRQSMHALLDAIARFYPCGYCASHFKSYLKTHPPNLDSARDLSQWFCHAHNEVNERTGKPQFDCSKVFERWKTGRPECF